MAKKKLVPDYKIDLSKDASVNNGTIANIYDSIKDSEKSFYSQLSRLRSKSSNNSITLADVARAFIRKDVDDSVDGELSFSKSIKSDNYSQGDLGSGWKISKDEFGRGTLEIDNINVRNELITKILTYDKIQSAGGTIILSAAWAELTKVEEVNENTINHKVICYYIPEGNFGQMWREGDIIKLQSGTNKYLMSYVENISNIPDAETGEYSFTIYHGGIANQIGESIPAVGDTLVQFGCLDDDLPERQNIIIMSVGDAVNGFPYIEQYSQINSFDLSGKLITRISDEVYFGSGDQSKYLWWNKNSSGEFLLKGTLNQSPSGDKTPPPVWRGNYSSVTPYYAGDLVMSGGNTYISIQNSINKPVGDVLYWTLYTSAGTGVDSVVQQFHISSSKTVQPVEGSAGWSTSAPAWSVGLYLWSRIKIIYKDPPSTIYTGYSVSTEWEAVNGIQVGGVNLMTRELSTGVSDTGWIGLLPVFNDDIYPYYLPDVWAMRYRFYNLPEGKYTFSVMVKAAVEDEFTQLRITELPGNAFIGWTTNEWTKLVHHFEVSYSSPTPTPQLLQPYFVSSDAVTLIKMANFQLESGTVATDYKLSPEDLQSNIENARQDELDLIDGYISAIEQDISGIQDQIDNVVVSWFGEYSPSESVEPQLTWLDYPTDEEKIQEQLNHINDTFTNTTEFIDITATPDAGKSWRFVETGTTPRFKWVRIQDSESAAAFLKASEALDVADGKRQVFWAQPTYEQFYDEGDIWLNASASGGGVTYVDEMLRCSTPKAANSSFSLSHWVLATKYTDNEMAELANENALAAISNAFDANSKLSQWASDSYIDPSEKQVVKSIWNEIQIEKEKNVAQALIYGASSTAYIQAYDDLDIYIFENDIILDTTEASPVVRAEFELAFSTYYLERQVLLNNIAQKAKDFVGSSIDDIQVGGRNYIKITDVPLKIQTKGSVTRLADYEWVLSGDATTSEVIFRISNVVNSNGFWTLSFDLRSNDGEDLPMHIDICDNESKEVIMTPDDKYTRVYITSLVLNYSSGLYNFIDFKCPHGVDYLIKNIQLEKGNKPTDWSRAPEDVQAEIDNVEVGGRNLILNSNKTSDITLLYGITADKITQALASSPHDDMLRINNITRISGDYVFYFDLKDIAPKFAQSTDWHILSFYIKTNNVQEIGVTVNYGSWEKVSIKEVNSTFKKFSVRIKPNYTGAANYNTTISLTGTGLTDIYIYGLKLERGNRATDWTPALEDSISLISATKTVRYSKWKAGNYYFAGNVDDGGVGNNPLRYLDYVTNNRTDSAIGAYECKAYHLASIYNEPKSGTPPAEWQNTTYFPTIAGDIALFNEAVLGGFKFSPSYDDDGYLIPSANQSFETSDGTPSTLPSIRLSGDGSGHFAGGNLSWNDLGNLIFKGVTSGEMLKISTDAISSLIDMANKENHLIPSNPAYIYKDLNYSPHDEISLLSSYSQQFELAFDSQFDIEVGVWHRIGAGVYGFGTDDGAQVLLQKLESGTWTTIQTSTYSIGGGTNASTRWLVSNLEVSKGTYRIIWDISCGYSSKAASDAWIEVESSCQIKYQYKVKKLELGIDGLALFDTRSEKYLRISLQDPTFQHKERMNLELLSPNGLYGIRITDSGIEYTTDGGMWDSLV